MLDMMMSEMNGSQVVTILWQHAGTRKITVIFVTSMAAEKNDGYCLSLGAVGYITKPVWPALLLVSV
ncbi:response regulator [Undibacterium sp. Di24W]|uniref:response regulator n=1 Tax=Undibacterium sp. Di24W TaxID=3413033 RepID=UPI003BF36E83